jgi:predicted DNA-binding helix-hairpin-helix protein
MGTAEIHNFFQCDLNTAPYELILRIPGIGVRSAKLIVANRKFGSISFLHLKRMGVAINRAKYFILCRELPLKAQTFHPDFKPKVKICRSMDCLVI